MTVSTTKHARNSLLASRVWSRGITASYAYDALGQLTNVHYSGNTPDVSFAYNRLGRMVSAITAVSSHLFEYAGLDLAGEIQDGVAITRSYDGLGRSTGFNMGDTYSAAYGYDDFGRFHSVSSSVCSVCSVVNYSCLPGSDLVSGYTAGPLAVTKTYEPARDLITTVSNHVNHVNPVLISAYDYANDSAGRRVSRNADSFGYNARSEVIGAVIGTNSYGYAHDAIGNRVFSAVNAVTNTYTANSLNQYTAVTPPIAVAYDADGNMTYYGDWYHTWDAENRLTGSQPAGFATNGAIRLEYVYNHKNLRVAKIKKQLSGRGADYPFNPLQPGTWDAIETRRYVWDGYNIAAEIVIDEVAPSTNVTYYTWGLDLSGTLQGAGGVGGLLAVTTADLAQPNSLTTYYPSYDANGNITDYVDAAGNIRAHYEYSPFGEITAQSGDLADTFTHRFSTKPFDAETSLVMYQLRPYAPGLGRWMSRDPIRERGGANVYCWVGNNAITFFDILGLKWTQQLVGSDFYVNFNVGVRGSLNAVDVFNGASAHFEFPDWKDPEFDKTSEGCACIKEGTGILNVHVKWWKVKEGVPTPADFRNTEGWKNLRKFHKESDLQMRTEHVGTFSEATIKNMNWHEETEVGMNKILYDNTLGIVEARIEECRCANLKKKFQYTYQLKKYINFDLAKRMFVRNTQKIADEFDRNFGFGGIPDDQGNLIQRMPRPRAEFKISDYDVWLKPDIW